MGDPPSPIGYGEAGGVPPSLRPLCPSAAGPGKLLIAGPSTGSGQAGNRLPHCQECNTEFGRISSTPGRGRWIMKPTRSRQYARHQFYTRVYPSERAD